MIMINQTNIDIAYNQENKERPTDSTYGIIKLY